MKLIAGVDEAGRGSIAGPVVAAAVILKPNIIIKDLKDSKKLCKRIQSPAMVLSTSYQIIEANKDMHRVLGWKNNAFNQYVSDLISLHRSLPDPRDQW